MGENNFKLLKFHNFSEEHEIAIHKNYVKKQKCGIS